ncbi:helix-turn-helix transcriptional regulator [uncultured Rhodospira sp.]|uniref:helix-turn-helix domain-containing protein n=1 Tax=uncultured Rhodospira sp. TaxID=1936189 RepID=UPI002612C71E|nr:helix-turn-helix transcriptional regulator [uncultured Rhodospira sp.]
MDVIVELERDHPDLAAEAPISSVALEIGEMVREMRLAAGMSQRDLAEAAGLHQSAISAIERGEGKDGPTYRKIRAIAKALGMDVAFVPLAVTARATRPVSVQPENDRSIKRRALP